MKRVICVFTAAVFLFNICIFNVYGANVSSWAKEDIEYLNSMKIIPNSMQNDDFTKPITRAEFCCLAFNMYKHLTNSQYELTAADFKDTSDPIIGAACKLNIMSGYDDGCFYPQKYITRQEIAAVIYRTLNIANKNITNYNSQILFEFTDKQDIAAWAYDSLASCVLYKIMQGTSENTLSPLDNASREQAAMIISRCIKTDFTAFSDKIPYDTLGCDVYGDASFVKYENRALTIKWSEVKETYVYDINIFLSSDNFWYSDDDVYISTLYSSVPTAEFKNLRAGKTYYITIDAKRADGSIIKSLSAFAYPHDMYSLAEKEKAVFPNGYVTSKSEADLQMQTITVNAWKINANGEKYASTLTLTVHKNIADVTKMAFEEIFNGEEKFPFKDVGAYSWRDEMSSGRYSHHNYGTAIDLNYNENYCLYKNGSFIGKYWKPNEDVYSIPPSGEVVSIFAKYGFKWGGDEWSNPKDYMHFSYLEL